MFKLKDPRKRKFSKYDDDLYLIGFFRIDLILRMAQKANTSLQNGNSHSSNATAEMQEKEARKRKEEQKKKEPQEAKKKPQAQPANPKKSFLLRAGPKKKFLEDPMRAIGDEDYDDFRKEILQLLSEVRQEAEHLPEADEPYIPGNLKTIKRMYKFDSSSAKNTAAGEPIPGAPLRMQ